MEKHINIDKMKQCGIYTIFFMLVSYMYAYTNCIQLFDAARIYRGKEPFVVTSDKWFLSFLGILDAHINIPWLAGLLSVLLMAIAVYCIVDILEIKSRLAMILTAGLCCTQSSIICQQEYTGGNYTGEFALLFACLAVWSVIRVDKRCLKICVSMFCIAISAGTYGAYIGMVPCLLMIRLLMDIVKGKNGRENWKNAIGYASVFLGGMILYYAILRGGLLLTQSTIQSYMGEDKLSSVSGVIESKNHITTAYIYLLKYYSGELNYLPDGLERLMGLVLLLGYILSMVLLKKSWKNICDKKENIFLLCIIIGLLPLAINLIYVLSSGNVHFLMIFPYVIPMLIVVKTIDGCKNKGERLTYGMRTINVLLISVFIYYSVVMANAVMVHMNHLFVEAQSISASLLARIENCEGFTGNEEVILIGSFQNNDYYKYADELEAEILDAYLVAWPKETKNGVHCGSLMTRHMKNILNSTLQYSYYDSQEIYLEKNSSIDKDIAEEIKQMAAYPRDGSVKKINNIIYVYMGEK